MAETFQVIGGAMATVDLALKMYKEIERFRLRVKQADEVGREMADKYKRLNKTLSDIHGALRCRQDQLGTQLPSDGEARVWLTIRDSLLGLRHAMRAFKKELEALDKGRDINVKRKWIDRAIWQLNLNKKQPVFEKLEEAASTRVDELTLSLFSLQIFMHTETNQYIQELSERIRSIESSLHAVSAASISATVEEAPEPQRRTTKNGQLQNCLRIAHALVETKSGGPAATSPGAQSEQSTSTSEKGEQDSKGLWANADPEKMFDKSGSPDRRGTIHIPPEQLPVGNLAINRTHESVATEEEHTYTFDTSDEEGDDDDDDSASSHSSVTELTNMDDIADPHERFETAQNSLSTTVTSASLRASSVASNYSSVSCTGIEQHKVSALMDAIKARDAQKVQNILESSESGSDLRRPSVTIDRIPILHMAVLKEAGPDVIRVLFNSTHVEVNATEPEEHKTALHWAVKYNRQACCACLLEAEGVDINARDKYKYTPLESALRFSAHSDSDVYKIIKILLHHGAMVPDPLPSGISATVEKLVKDHKKKRRPSSSVSGPSGTTGANLTHARTAGSERRSSDDGSSFRRRWTSISRTISARN